MLRLTERLALALLIWLVASSVNAQNDESPQWSFVIGHYDLIGQFPDSKKTYSGTARIEREGDQITLTRIVGNKKTKVVGRLRRADPGEAEVLSFHWREKYEMEMVCLIGADLDNYARMSCHWGRAGNPHKTPGKEAFFSQEPWR